MSPKSTPAPKDILNYKYTVKIHEADPNTGEVKLLFEEVDGNDGFAVTITESELRQMLSDDTFDEWAKEQVNQRIGLLIATRQREEAKKQAKQQLADVEEKLKNKKYGKPQKP